MRSDNLTDDSSHALSKVPRITFAFWIVKIFATSVGETAGDAVSMTLNLGYDVSTTIFFAFFFVTLAVQVSSKRYHPVFYWPVVAAMTTVGATTSDYFDRSLGLGYVKSSLIELAAVVVMLVAWKLSTGSIAADRITTRKNEIFYWVTILVSNTLGIALGEYVATTTGIGLQRAALVFASLITVMVVTYFNTNVSRAVLFWVAYVLTRPLGETLRDTLTKTQAEGGLGFGLITSSVVIAVGMVAIIAMTSLRKRDPVEDRAATI